MIDPERGSTLFDRVSGTTLTRREALAVLGGGVMATMTASCAPASQQDTVPPIEGPLHYASLVDVARHIESRQISPVELTEMMLARIQSLDGGLNSYLAIMTDQAREAARAAEAEITSGSYRGPLHGIPIAVKDLCYTEGVPTTGGMPVLADFVPDFDATVVERLEQAGAVILGKLNLTEGAMAGYHPDFEIPVNPWGEDLAVGGSSSGSGVATAAGLCYASLGTDTGGSIRFPSASNGIVGLKPTYGRVSRYGVLVLADTLDHVGPMTRYVADAAAMFEVIAGADPNDATSISEPVPNMGAALTGDVRGMRIGFDPVYANTNTVGGLVDAMTGALSVYEGLGAEIVEVQMPAFGMDHFNMWIAICSYEALRAHAAFFPARADEYGAFLRDFLNIGLTITDEAYGISSASREAFSDSFRAALSGVDAVLCPSGHVPSPVSDDVGYGGFATAAEEVEADPVFKYTFPADFAGTPTLTLPCGANEAGVPYAMQLMGSRLSEASLCRLGYAYEQATEWHRRRPSI